MHSYVTSVLQEAAERAEAEAREMATWSRNAASILAALQAEHAEKVAQVSDGCAATTHVCNLDIARV